MKKQLIKYLILPKGIKSILFKSYVYLIPFLYSWNFLKNRWQNLLWFLFILFLFEFIINPARYQLNDLRDRKEDQQRKHHWHRLADENNKQIIFITAASRFLLGTAIAFSLDIKLGYLAILFLVLQIFYDLFAKRYSPFLAIFTVSIAYPLRSLTVFYGLKIEIDQTVFLLLLSVFLYATYMVFQWRKNESFFILSKNLAPKPHSDFFAGHKINSIIFLNLLFFLVSFILLVTSLTRLNKNSVVITYILSSAIVIILSLLNKDTFKRLFSHSHNIFIVFIFVILTFNRFLITLAICLIIILVTFWYHRIYVEKFANNYFDENHHDKI